MFEHRRWIFNNRAYHFIFQQGILAHGIYPMGLLKVESRLFSDKAPFGSTYLSAFFCPTGSARARDGWLITPVGIFVVQSKQRKLWNTTDLGVFECSRNPAVANNGHDGWRPMEKPGGQDPLGNTPRVSTYEVRYSSSSS